MKQLDKESYDTLQLLDKSYNVSLNTIKINVHNKLEHELAKFFLAWEIAKNGNNFITEGIFKNNKRCDVLDLKNKQALEVVDSETIESQENKKAEYPTDIRFIKSKSIITYWLDNLG